MKNLHVIATLAALIVGEHGYAVSGLGCPHLSEQAFSHGITSAGGVFVGGHVWRKFSSDPAYFSLPLKFPNGHWPLDAYNQTQEGNFTYCYYEAKEADGRLFELVIRRNS